jgi:hypothetical protein
MWGIQYIPVKPTAIQLHGKAPSTVWKTLERVFGAGEQTIRLDSTHREKLTVLDDMNEGINAYRELLEILDEHSEILLETY